jgi:hypothetical protein
MNTPGSRTGAEAEVEVDGADGMNDTTGGLDDATAGVDELA